MRTGYECGAGLFKHGYRQFAGHRGKVIQKDLQRVTRFQVIKERLDWDPCSKEHRSSAVNLGIDGDQLLIHNSTSGDSIGPSIARSLSISAQRRCIKEGVQSNCLASVELRVRRSHPAQPE